MEYELAELPRLFTKANSPGKISKTTNQKQCLIHVAEKTLGGKNNNNAWTKSDKKIIKAQQQQKRITQGMI